MPEHLDITADMACGAQLQLHVSTITGVGAENGVTLFGTDSTLSVSGGRISGAKRGDTELAEIVVPDDEAVGWRVEEEFIACIRGEEEVKLTDPATGVRYMEFADAVVASIQSGRGIGLPLVDMG
jgi:predicted dehydrogenase